MPSETESAQAPDASVIIRSVHRLLRVLSTALITAGLVLLADVALTLAWKEPLSTIYGSIQQGKAEDELRALEERFPSQTDLKTVEGAKNLEERVRLLAGLFEDEVERGEGIGRIRIDRIGLDTVVVEGTDTESLRKGPGHYTLAQDVASDSRGDGSAFPGQGKTVGIAGHRTTYLAPFRRINEIEDGDEIVLELPYATFTYAVQKHEIVEPTDVEIVRNVGYDRLVLTACHPLYSAAERWAVFARLVEINLFAPGDRVWQDP
jgi:sortase A